MILFHYVHVQNPSFSRIKIKKWINSVIQFHQKKLGEINIVFCNDNYLLEINKKWLNHDYYTDIITFNYNENDYINGDLYISLNRVEDNSLKYNSDFSDELNRVIIHGILHLLGYDDNNPSNKHKIRQAEDIFLSKLNNAF